MPPALPDRPISHAPNLVTARGLALIEQAIVAGPAPPDRGDRDRGCRCRRALARDLRYWTARHATAQLTEPAADAASVVFGVAVTGRREDGRMVTFRLVGEDEADPAQGRIAWTAPVARTLLGSEPGDTRELPTGSIEVTAIDPRPEADV